MTADVAALRRWGAPWALVGPPSREPPSLSSRIATLQHGMYHTVNHIVTEFSTFFVATVTGRAVSGERLFAQHSKLSSVPCVAQELYRDELYRNHWQAKFLQEGDCDKHGQHLRAGRAQRGRRAGRALHVAEAPH